MAFTYIIIGAGSAGCVLANRLSEDPRNRVLLLEAGGKDSNFWIHVPLGFAKLLTHPTLNWNFKSEPEDNVSGRSIPVPRGRVLGGSSSINGMVFVRGASLDYNIWAQLGNRGWSYEDVLPYFRKFERNELGSDDYRSTEGPLNVAEMNEPDELVQAFIGAGVECGYPRNPDYNGKEMDGFNFCQVTQRRGRRESTARAYLNPIKSRPNLTIETGARVTKILIDNKRATGITYRLDGIDKQAHAEAEIILAAGAVQSPQLLELSGIGQPELLRSHGIEVVHELPGVGENFRDHYLGRINWRVNRPITLNERSRGLRLVGEVMKWGLTRRGFLSFNSAPATGFVRTRDGLDAPDVQIFFVPGSFKSAMDRKFDPEPGITMAAYQCRPESQGSIHIASNDINDAPKIRPNYLAEQLDQETLIAGLHWCRKLAATNSLGQYILHEMNPGKDVTSDQDLLQYARDTGGTSYHPMGTCKMGRDNDPMAVVDDHLRVRGLEGLRVIDASIFPTMPSGNINAPVIMTAEKGADLVKQDARATTHTQAKSEHATAA